MPPGSCGEVCLAAAKRLGMQRHKQPRGRSGTALNGLAGAHITMDRPGSPFSCEKCPHSGMEKGKTLECLHNCTSEELSEANEYSSLSL